MRQTGFHSKTYRTRKTTKFAYHVNWTKSDLLHAGLVRDVTRKKTVSITDEGKRLMATSPKKIDARFLTEHYEGYRRFKSRKSSKKSSAQTDEIESSKIFSDEEIGEPRIKTKEEWIEILKKEMNEEKSFFPTLLCYLERPNYEGGMREIEQACGVKGLNLRSYLFGKRVIEWSGIPQQFRDKNKQFGKQRFFNIAFVKGNFKNHPWRLRPELAEALLSIDPEDYGFIDDNPIMIEDIDAVSEIQIVEWDYIKKHVPQGSKNTNPVKMDHERLSKRQRDIGNAGEERILRYERDKLEKCGRKDLSERVRWVSKEDGDGLGYDISSFDENGNEIFIEVKATAKPATRLQFYISANEVQKYFDSPNFFIYFLYSLKDRPKLHIVERNQFIQNKQKFLTPYQYYVDVDVSAKDITEI